MKFQRIRPGEYRSYCGRVSIWSRHYMSAGGYPSAEWFVSTDGGAPVRFDTLAEAKRSTKSTPPREVAPEQLSHAEA